MCNTHISLCVKHENTHRPICWLQIFFLIFLYITIRYEIQWILCVFIFRHFPFRKRFFVCVCRFGHTEMERERKNTVTEVSYILQEEEVINSSTPSIHWNVSSRMLFISHALTAFLFSLHNKRVLFIAWNSYLIKNCLNFSLSLSLSNLIYI